MDIKVFVSSLGAYNEGTLTGQWTELPVDDVQKDILDKVEGAVGDEYFIEKLLGLIKQGYPTILIWGGIALSAPFLFYFYLFTSLFMI